MRFYERGLQALKVFNPVLFFINSESFLANMRPTSAVSNNASEFLTKRKKIQNIYFAMRQQLKQLAWKKRNYYPLKKLL